MAKDNHADFDLIRDPTEWIMKSSDAELLLIRKVVEEERMRRLQTTAASITNDQLSSDEWDRLLFLML